MPAPGPGIHAFLGAARDRRGGSRNSPPLPQVSEPVSGPSSAPPAPRRRRVLSARGPAAAGVSRSRVRGNSASSERSGGERRCEVTHSLGNNRTDKLQGTRRSQARVCGRRRPDVPGGPRGSESTPGASKGVFKQKTETPTTSLALARRPPPQARPPPTFAALPRTCRTMSLAPRPKPPDLPRAPEPGRRPESRAERGAQAERAASGPERPRLEPPPPLRSPTWRGPRVWRCTKGRGVEAGDGSAPAPAGTRRRPAAPSPAAPPPPAR